MKVYSLSSSITIIATFAALHLPGQVIAQTVNYNTPRFSEAFADPDGTTAAALAKTTGLNIGEATRRLRLMNEAGRMVHALEERFPDTFSGAEALSSSDFRVSIYEFRALLDPFSEPLEKWLVQANWAVRSILGLHLRRRLRLQPRLTVTARRCDARVLMW